jgi:hypothetical protein
VRLRRRGHGAGLRARVLAEACRWRWDGERGWGLGREGTVDREVEESVLRAFGEFYSYCQYVTTHAAQ